MFWPISTAIEKKDYIFDVTSLQRIAFYVSVLLNYTLAES